MKVSVGGGSGFTLASFDHVLLCLSAEFSFHRRSASSQYGEE